MLLVRQDEHAWLKPTTVGSIALASRRRPRARACSRFTSRVIATPTRSRGARRSISAACSSTAAASRPEQPLAAGDELEFHRPPWREPEAPESFDGRVRGRARARRRQARRICRCCPRGRSRRARCSSSCARATRRAREAAPAHRLGRGTSGLIAFGKTRARPLVAEPPAARVHARQDVSRVGRRRALADLVRGAAADRAHTARPADDPCRGGARSARR